MRGLLEPFALPGRRMESPLIFHLWEKYRFNQYSL